MKKVSIIIPCYNAEEFIERSFNIILNDKLKDIEIIAINDGSKDKTLEILESFSKKYSQIKVINQQNTGQAIARNNALKKATGKYIMFVDIDDFLAPNAVHKMYNYAEKHKNDYLICDFYKHYIKADISEKNNYNEDNKKNAIMANYAPWGKLISRELIEKNNFKFLEGKIFEDIAVMPLLAAKSNNPGYIKETLYYYNLIDSSTTRTKEYKKKYEDIFDVSDYIFNNLKDTDIFKKYYEEFEYIYLKGILRSNILIFAKYKEGIKQINSLRKNVLNKFPKILKNSYHKKENLKIKIITFITIHAPSYCIYLLKKFF